MPGKHGLKFGFDSIKKRLLYDSHFPSFSCHDSYKNVDKFTTSWIACIILPGKLCKEKLVEYFQNGKNHKGDEFMNTCSSYSRGSPGDRQPGWSNDGQQG